MALPDSSPGPASGNDRVSARPFPPPNTYSKKPVAKRSFKSLRRSLRGTNSSLQQGWEENRTGPYHEYVHQLVDAGWDNLKTLDEYMSQNRKGNDQDLTVSILDITDNLQRKPHDDIHDE